jgi:hypothetical protein
MSIVVSADPRIQTLEVSDDLITARLADGRIISVPLVWSWRLAGATAEQRANYEILGDGHGAHWPDLGEDLSAEGLLAGSPARQPRKRDLKPGS